MQFKYENHAEIPGKHMAFHLAYDCPSYVAKELALFQMIIHKFYRSLEKV